MNTVVIYDTQQIYEDLGKLKNHFKRYYCGAYSALYMQLNTNFKIQDILEMRLKDVFYIDEIVRVKEKIQFAGSIFVLSEEKRKELAWYILQRTSKYATVEELEDYLCVNTRGMQLKKPTYRKSLATSCDQLDLGKRYTMTLLRSLYGYLAVVSGEKPLKVVAQEYAVAEYYLLNVTFKELKINYSTHMIDEIANVKRG